jgi:four helix bundle protein
MTADGVNGRAASVGQISSYRDLRVWQIGMDLAESCYRLSRSFPQDEIFGLTSQVRRAAISIPANIAEGYGRETRGDYVKFLRISQGSLKELETHLLLAERVLSVQAGDLTGILRQTDDLGRMLRSLIRSLQP